MSIIVLGDLILDDYKIVDVNRVSPEAPCLIGLHSSEYTRLGGAANVAANIFQLDTTVSLVGQGDYDIFFPLIHDIGIPCLLYNGLHSTKVRFIDKKSHVQLFRYDIEQITQQDSRKNIDEYAAFIDKLNFERYNVCVIVDYMKGMIRYNDVKKINGCAINIVSTKNPNPTRILPKKLKNSKLENPINILILNEREYNACVNFHGYQFIIRTEGCNGISIFRYTYEQQSELVVHIPGIKVDVFDVTGAGDTVSAVVAYCLDKHGFSEKNLISACHCANIAASRVVAKIGTAVLDIESDTLLTLFKDSLLQYEHI